MTDKPETCASTSSSVLSRYFQKKTLPLVGGAPCSGNQGYCDKFQVCRLLDADGPIARLKNSFLNLDDFDDLGEWMKVNIFYKFVNTTIRSQWWTFNHISKVLSKFQWAYWLHLPQHNNLLFFLNMHDIIFWISNKKYSEVMSYPAVSCFPSLARCSAILSLLTPFSFNFSGQNRDHVQWGQISVKSKCNVISVSLLQAHWWAILLAILTFSGVMGCTVCLCGRTLVTDDLD